MMLLHISLSVSANKVYQDSLMEVFCAALSFPAQIAFIQDVSQMSLRRFPCRYRFYPPIMLLDSVYESQCPLMTPESAIQPAAVLSYGSSEEREIRCGPHSFRFLSYRIALR